MDNQESQWENAFKCTEDMFGSQESDCARKALDIFKRENCESVLEIGAGQGRDTIFFIENGLRIHALDYSTKALNTIKDRAKQINLSSNVKTLYYDVRKPLPFDDNTFDACYSHMLYCMALNTKELEFLSKEICRVLKPNAYNIYTVRSTSDKHYKVGIHIGENMYQAGDFIVHFFDRVKIQDLSEGYEIVEVEELEEGDLPRKLYFVVMKKKSTY